MDPKSDTLRLMHLLAAVRHGSLSQAATACGLTQPALSKSIQALERSIGAPALQRGRGGVVPTAIGEALVLRAQAIAGELQGARSDIATLRDHGTVAVTIGCGPSEATRLLPIALTRARRDTPGLRVTVLSGLNEALMPMVKSGEVAFALSSVPRTARDPALEHETLHEDTAAVIARGDHPLSSRRTVQPADLAGARWVLARRRELERRALDDLFLEAGLKPVDAEVETTSTVLMKSVVLRSDFLTFLPRELIHWEERAGLLRALPVAAPRWARSVGLTWRRGAARGAAAQALAETLRAAVASMRRRAASDTP